MQLAFNSQKEEVHDPFSYRSWCQMQLQAVLRIQYIKYVQILCFKTTFN
jgi:hypothetical protein